MVVVGGLYCTSVSHFMCKGQRKGSWCSPESRVVQRRVAVFILDLDGAVGLQQGLHHLHVALVGGDLKRSLALVLDVHLPGTQTQLQVH